MLPKRDGENEEKELPTIGFDRFAEVFLRSSRSTSRYKSLVVHTQAPGCIRQFIQQFQRIEPHFSPIDGLQWVALILADQPADPIAMKYWLQKQVLEAQWPTGLFHFDWLLGRWNEPERNQWWQNLAQLETNAALLFGACLAPSFAQGWQPLVTLQGPQNGTTTPRITIFKPSLSKLSLVP